MNGNSARAEAMNCARCHMWSFPLCGNGLFKPLDFSAACSKRRSTTCIHAGVPSRCIQDFLSINDGGGWGQAFGRNGKGIVGMATHLFSLRRHSSEGWNPGGEAEG